MPWSPINYIVTILACAIVIVPLVCFFVAGLIGTYFARLEKYQQDMIKFGAEVSRIEQPVETKSDKEG